MRTSGLATAALVVGILSVIGSIAWLGLLLGPVAAFMGSRAGKRIAASDGKLRGSDRASTGQALGVIGFIASAASVSYTHLTLPTILRV